jgi:hypothetical protein
MLANFLAINAMHQWDVEGRNGLPLGDENWHGSLINTRDALDTHKREPIDGSVPV